MASLRRRGHCHNDYRKVRWEHPNVLDGGEHIANALHSAANNRPERLGWNPSIVAAVVAARGLQAVEATEQLAKAAGPRAA